MTAPVIIRGVAAIGERLGLSASTVQAMHRRGLLPTFGAGASPCATGGALDEWRTLYVQGKIPID